MFLKLRATERFLDLHLTTGLHDWDMNEEIHLGTTTDQFYQGIHYALFKWLGSVYFLIITYLSKLNIFYR